MKPYQLRRAIRQVAFIRCKPYEPPPPDPARYFGGLLHYAASSILGLIRNPEDVSLITVKGHEPALPYQFTVMQRSEAKEIYGGDIDFPPPHVLEVTRYTVEPKRLAVRNDDGPILVIYGGYVDALKTFYLFEPLPRMHGPEDRIARKPNTTRPTGHII